MKKVQGLAISKILLAALGISLMMAEVAPAQVNIPIFTGKFTLTNQIQWNKTVLQPGNYTIAIGSMGSPMSVLIRDARGRPVAQFISGINDGKTGRGNALLLKEKSGQLCVYSLELASLGRVLIYDRSLQREAVLEAHAPQTVPVMLAKR